MDHTKLSNNEFKNLLDDIAAKADGNAADFFLTQGLIDQIKTAGGVLTADISDQAAKQSAAKAATNKLGQTRKDGDKLVSLLKRTMKANADFSPDKYVEFGFDADDLTPSAIAPQTPADLSVEGFSNGTNELKFNRNGNKTGTVFIIEAKIGEAANYSIIGTTKKTNYRHTGQKPGVKIVYRLRAQRGDQFSEYSNEAVIYEP